MNIDLQQRSVEFSQLFKSHNNLRPALLEKMPPMQVARISNQNSDYAEDNGRLGELIENGLEGNGDNRIPASDSVRFKASNYYSLIFIFSKFEFFFLRRVLYWICSEELIVQ